MNEAYRRLISGYMLRHKVRPGITGWAHVNGSRGGNDLDSMRRRLELDLEYLKQASRPSAALDFHEILDSKQILGP